MSSATGPCSRPSDKPPRRSVLSVSARTIYAGRARRALSQGGGDLKQIKFLLGHSSIQTTGCYPGSKQDLQFADHDYLGL